MKTINIFIIVTAVILLTGSSFRNNYHTTGNLNSGFLPDTSPATQLDIADNTPAKTAAKYDVVLPISHSPEFHAEAMPDLGYLRFDVNSFMAQGEQEISELPEKEDFSYLKFNVGEFTEQYSVEMKEMPVSEFDYLRFDVNRFISSESTQTSFELPETE